MISLHDPHGARLHRHCWSKARDLRTCIWTPASSLSWARRLGVVLDVSSATGSSLFLSCLESNFLSLSTDISGAR